MVLLVIPSIAGAGEISAAHRGTWTESGACSDSRKIVISGQTISLVQPGHARVLTDGDESVFKGETVVNASLPAKNEQEPVLGFSARMVESGGAVELVTEGAGANKEFAGTFKKCSSATTTASRTHRSKTQQTASRIGGPRYEVNRQRPQRGIPLGTVLGGLY
ncbi:MAG: hypothetical protein JWL62_524 [Hyphomicrobiales bacterium]|nr:hypothetical protein [Hyphomicrobiales bacterium]